MTLRGPPLCSAQAAYRCNNNTLSEKLLYIFKRPSVFKPLFLLLSPNYYSWGMQQQQTGVNHQQRESKTGLVVIAYGILF
jgi:hypothetical protein